MAVQTRPHDAQDGAGEQDGEGRVRADEGGGEGRRHDGEGRRGCMGQRSEEGDERSGESREHEGAEAERPDAGAGLGVGQVSPLAARPSLRRCRSLLSCGMPLLAGNTCPVSLHLPRIVTPTLRAASASEPPLLRGIAVGGIACCVGVHCLEKRCGRQRRSPATGSPLISSSAIRRPTVGASVMAECMTAT